MKIGLVGLGKMGYNLALQMRDKGVEVVAYNRSEEKLKAIEKEGVETAYSLEALIDNIGEKKIVWLMIPAGQPIDDMLEALIPLLTEDDVIIDGGNSNYKDTMRRCEQLEKKGIELVDVGTSGGVTGARHGACMMVGGPADEVDNLDSVFTALCVEGGFQYMGETGTGHFVKMVHNGIEYGMMQAIGEGFELLSSSDFDLELEKVATVWNNGSIISGYLMEMAGNAFLKDGNLDDIAGRVDSSGEGLWTVQEALALKVPLPVITEALYARYRSKQDDTFSGKVVAAMRNEFGGHTVYKK